MEIHMPRGDRRPIKFRFKNKGTGEVVDLNPDEIYFTCKDTNYKKDFLFQKKLSNSSIVVGDNGYYSLVIEPEDTDNLTQERDYDIDVEIYKLNSIKQTITGKLYLEKEVTHACNESVTS